MATVTTQLLSPNGEIEVRTYNPQGTGPAIVFVHGGGWIAGSIDTHDGMARWFASQTDAILVSVGYSLAPEHPFPQAVIEVAAAIAAIERDTEAGRRLFVMGDSSGANIAAMAILRLSSIQRGRISGFVSIYGAYSPEMDLSSHRLYGDGRFGLSEPRMRWCWTLYAPQFFPQARDQLTPLGSIPADFPPALCVGAECDVLLDDTLALYSRLAEARVDVSLSLWPGLPHGCLHYVGVVDSVTNAARSIVQFIDSHGLPSRAAEAPIQPATLDDGIASVEVLRDVDALFESSRTRLHGSVTHRLAIDILGGTLQPRQTLPTEEAASASMGISRSAYREALRTLSAKGLVTSSPKVGTRIAPREQWSILDGDVLAWSFEAAPSEQFVRDLFELRKSIEPSAASMAADRRDATDLAALSKALARLADSPPDSMDWLDATVDYHRGILTASKNAALPGLWPAINATLRWTAKLQMMLPTLQLVHDTVADHARVFKKIKTQDAAGAQTEMRNLIETSFVDAIANLGRVRRASSARSDRD
ncbi:MAG: alpha/beta hydrolase fold domain-containing protein [Devosia sp.]